jgi:DNA-binding FadR family transcriptional regulator
MQATTCFHDGVPNSILQEADFVFHDSLAFHSTNGMFDPDADR